MKFETWNLESEILKMVSFPHCKINLGLNVVRKREDGYHDIETCFFPVPWTDILEIIPSEKLQFQSSGNAIPGDVKDNLCLKAYTILKKDFDIPAVKIHLHKIIPTGAGLGGGSSDAAFSLRMLNEIFSLNLSTEQLVKYAAQLGSDCAFFIQDGAMMGTGRGEKLAPVEVNLTGKFLLLIKPDVHVSTADAYAGVTPRLPSESIENILSLSPDSWKQKLVNDFELSVFKKFSVIRDIKDQLYTLGAAYASMSGSGSSVFGIFRDDPAEVAGRFSTFMCWKGEIRS